RARIVRERVRRSPGPPVAPESLDADHVTQQRASGSEAPAPLAIELFHRGGRQDVQRAVRRPMMKGVQPLNVCPVDLRHNYRHSSCACRGRTSTERIVSILTWIIVGLVAGVLAPFVVGGGYGLIGDIIIGIIGAFVGGWIFRALGTSTPFGGLAGVIFVAFIGAVVLLFLLRLVRGARYRA